MNVLGLFGDSFDEKIKCEAEMCADIGRTAFNGGMTLLALEYLKYAEKLHSSAQVNTLLTILLESQISTNYIVNKYWKLLFLKKERQRLINNTKELLKLIENGNTDENEYKNIGKIDLNPKQFLETIFKKGLKLEKLEEILSQAQLLFSDDQLNPYLEILSEKKKRREYSFKPENLNINNLEDAEICIDKAKKAINVGQYEKAKRLLLKAERLHHTRKGKELLQQVLNVKERQRSLDIPNEDDLKKIPKQNATKPDNNIKQKLEDSIAAIQRIMEARNNYDVLGVSEESSIADIKKAFRRLSLVVHPDKTKASGASEAFKAVTSAMEALVQMKKKK